MRTRAHSSVPRNGMKMDMFSPQNATELNINFLLIATVYVKSLKGESVQSISFAYC